MTEPYGTIPCLVCAPSPGTSPRGAGLASSIVDRPALETIVVVDHNPELLVQDTGGCFGLKDPDPQRAWLGGLAALTDRGQGVAVGTTARRSAGVRAVRGRCGRSR